MYFIYYSKFIFIKKKEIKSYNLKNLKQKKKHFLIKYRK